MNNMEKFREIIKKYGIDINYSQVVDVVHNLLREYNFQKENYWRTTLNENIQLRPSVFSLPNTYNYKDLYLDHYFVYNLENNKYHENEIRLFYALLRFLNKYSYIDNDWDIDKAKLLKKFIEDEDLNKIFLQNLNKKSSELVRESSYYYKDDVYKFVIENKLLKK